jgi:hypothetical protein
LPARGGEFTQSSFAIALTIDIGGVENIDAVIQCLSEEAAGSVAADTS